MCSRFSQLCCRPGLFEAKLAFRHTKDEMQRELLEQMYRTNELDDLLKESDHTVRRRKECMQMVESLSKASEIVSQVQ